jgi:hypothetical protein
MKVGRQQLRPIKAKADQVGRECVRARERQGHGRLTNKVETAVGAADNYISFLNRKGLAFLGGQFSILQV